VTQQILTSDQLSPLYHFIVHLPDKIKYVCSMIDKEPNNIRLNVKGVFLGAGKEIVKKY
jgi:hypothetical protein